MADAKQNGRETYRVIVLSRDGTKVLLVPNGVRHTLPSVGIPRWERVAEKLTAAIRSDWGEEVVCLFETETAPPTDGVRYQTAEHLRTRSNPAMATRWVPVSALCQESLTDARDYSALEQAIQVCDVENGPFSRLGWFSELRTWIESVVEPMGLHVSGEFRQLNASPSFSLVRFETDGPALWFKAVGKPNLREFPVTLTLTGLFPKYLPQIFAVQAECNGWLTPEIEGTSLSETQGITSWEAAAVALAKLQIESINASAPILKSGAHNLQTPAISKQVDPFLDVMRRLMEQQTKATPRALSRKELALLGEHIRNALRLIKTSDIPDCLGSLDFNPGNIIASQNGCKFLDWAEAYVGHPFLTFAYLQEHFRRAVAGNGNLERQLTTSYTAPWKQLFSPDAIAESITAAPLLAVFAYASGCGLCSEERLRDPENAAYLRGLTRRMNREANEMQDRRSACLS
ncbi:MAG: hypothetical protein ACM3JB_11005 [Acidobacteriaceae bacterium]